MKRFGFAELGPVLGRSVERLTPRSSDGDAAPDERSRRQRLADAVKPFSADDWAEARWYGRAYIVVKVSFTPEVVSLKISNNKCLDRQAATKDRFDEPSFCVVFLIVRAAACKNLIKFCHEGSCIHA